MIPSHHFFTVHVNRLSCAYCMALLFAFHRIVGAAMQDRNDSVVLTVPDSVDTVTVDGRALTIGRGVATFLKSRVANNVDAVVKYKNGEMTSDTLSLLPETRQCYTIPNAPLGFRRPRFPCGHGSEPLHLAMFLDERLIATFDSWGEVVIRDAANGEERMRFYTRPDSKQSRIQLSRAPSASADGQRILAWRTPSSVCVFESQTGRPFGEIALESASSHARLCPDGQRLVEFTSNKGVCRWQVDGSTPCEWLCGRDKSRGTFLAFSPGCDVLATASDSGDAIAVVDLEAGGTRRHFSVEGFQIKECVFAGPRATLVTVWTPKATSDRLENPGPRRDDRLIAWDKGTGEEIISFDFPRGNFPVVAATGSEVAYLDCLTSIVRIDLHKRVHETIATKLPSSHELLCVDRSGRSGAICDVRPDKNDFRIVSLPSGDTLCRMESEVSTYAWANLSREDQWLVCVVADRRSVHTWDLKKGVLRHRLSVEGRITAVDSDIAGGWLAITREASDRMSSPVITDIWNLDSGENTLSVHVTDQGYTKRCSSDGRFLAWIDGQHVVTSKDIISGGASSRFHVEDALQATHLVFVGKSAQVIVGDTGGGVTTFDLAQSERTGRLSTPLKAGVHRIEVSDNGERAVVSDEVGRWVIIDVTRMRILEESLVQSNGWRKVTSDGNCRVLAGLGGDRFGVCDLLDSRSKNGFRRIEFNSIANRQFSGLSSDAAVHFCLRSGIPEVIDTMTGETLLTLLAFRDFNEWCVVSERGYVDGSARACDRVGVYIRDDKTQGTTVMQTVVRVPGVLKRVVSGCIDTE
jgi:hypothetical protein